MNPKAGLAIAGVLGVAGLVAIAIGGKQTTTTQGVVFQAPSDASVAAVESAAASEANSVNALAVQRSQIASQTLLGLAGLQEQLNLGTLAAHSTDLQTASAAEGVALQQSTSVHATDVAGQVADYANMITAGTQQLVSANTLTSQNYQTQTNATAAEQASNNALAAALASIKAQVEAATINANASVANTATTANATIAQSNNQTTAAQAAAGAQKTSAFWGALGSIGGALTKFIPSSAAGAAGSGGSSNLAANVVGGNSAPLS